MYMYGRSGLLSDMVLRKHDELIRESSACISDPWRRQRRGSAHHFWLEFFQSGLKIEMLKDFWIPIAIAALGCSGLVLGLDEEHVYSSCKNPGQFALTFDDGPSLGRTDAVLNVLRNYNVSATFFVCGQTYTDITQNPDAQALLHRMVDEGHQIGVHTWNHRYLPDRWRTADEVRYEIQSVHDALWNLTGIKPTIMRPPYGAYNETTVAIAQEFGLDVILWNLNTLDWSHPGDTLAGMANYIETTNGTSPDTHSFIALHHDPEYGSAELAQAAVGFMLNLTYRFVTIDECIHG